MCRSISPRLRSRRRGWGRLLLLAFRRAFGIAGARLGLGRIALARFRRRALPVLRRWRLRRLRWRRGRGGLWGRAGARCRSRGRSRCGLRSVAVLAGTLCKRGGACERENCSCNENGQSGHRRASPRLALSRQRTCCCLDQRPGDARVDAPARPGRHDPRNCSAGRVGKLPLAPLAISAAPCSRRRACPTAPCSSCRSSSSGSCASGLRRRCCRTSDRRRSSTARYRCTPYGT